MLLDVDHFKEINDEFGHPAGDDKLRDISQAFAGVMRKGDIVARYGGDEFIILAPETNRDDGVALAERLRAAAASCGIGVSIGVAVFPADASQQDALIAAADAALYRAKDAGRDCVRASGQAEPSLAAYRYSSARSNLRHTDSPPIFPSIRATAPPIHIRVSRGVNACSRSDNGPARGDRGHGISPRFACPALAHARYLSRPRLGRRLRYRSWRALRRDRGDRAVDAY